MHLEDLSSEGSGQGGSAKAAQIGSKWTLGNCVPDSYLLWTKEGKGNDIIL